MFKFCIGEIYCLYSTLNAVTSMFVTLMLIMIVWKHISPWHCYLQQHSGQTYQSQHHSPLHV